MKQRLFGQPASRRDFRQSAGMRIGIAAISAGKTGALAQ
jgi:hypothetical protein